MEEMEYAKYDAFFKYNNNNNNNHNEMLQTMTSAQPRMCSRTHRKVANGLLANHGGTTSKPGSNIKVILENKHIFEKFSKLGTEMIITKTGR